MIVRIYCGGVRKRYDVIDRNRATFLKIIAKRLSSGGLEAHAETILRAAATTDNPREVSAAVELLCTRKEAARDTFRSVAEAWTTGELHQRYPDHVREKASVDSDEVRLGVLYDSIGSVAVNEFTLADAERAMSHLPATARASATRRHYAQLISKVLRLAVFPLRLIERSPLPAGWLPIIRNSKVTAWLYPDEDLQLISCPSIPLHDRLLYGFLAREGCRYSEAMGLSWSDLDLRRGTVRLDVNKTEDPRTWVLSPGVVSALRDFRGIAPAEAPVFHSEAKKPAQTFRRHLRVAGIARPELYEATGARRPIRLHDLRATFITVALSVGRSETWVADRTGHTSSLMIHRYRRAARSAAELGLGDLAPLSEAIGQKIGQSIPAEQPNVDELPY